MGVDPITIGGDAIDLGGRVAVTQTVVGSPALAAETVIASLTLPSHLRPQEFVRLSGWAAFTVGTSGTAVRLRIRRTNVGGAVVADSDALTAGIAAAGKGAQDIEGVDVAGTDTYVMTMQVTAGAAVSTVSQVLLACEIF